MELGNQIKAHRAALSLSQEELAEKVYVTRQTVSNWETGKSYPDIHSLLLLSALFDVSLDQLIKGDLETMKQEVNAADVKAMNRNAIIYTVLLAATIILPVPLLKWFDLYGLIPELLLWGSAMYFALRLERIKKGISEKKGRADAPLLTSDNYQRMVLGAIMLANKVRQLACLLSVDSG